MEKIAQEPVLSKKLEHEEALLPEALSVRKHVVGGPGEPQPVIGIPVPIQQGKHGPLLHADAAGVWAIERMGGRVVLIPVWPFPTHRHVYQSLWPLLQSMDGLFLPARIQEKDEPCTTCDSQAQQWGTAWEVALAQLATTMGMPILAIADGAVLWNEAAGGRRGETREGSSQTAPSSKDAWEHHSIRVRARSTLASCIQHTFVDQSKEQKSWELAFIPDQGMKTIAPGLRSCAQLEDATVVAFERSDSAFGLGMIGRLDWGLDHCYGMAIFDAFFQACLSFDRFRHRHRGWEASRDTICAILYERVTLGLPLLPSSPLVHDRKRPHPAYPPGSSASLGMSFPVFTAEEQK